MRDKWDHYAIAFILCAQFQRSLSNQNRIPCPLSVNAYYHFRYSADEAQLEPRPQAMYNKRDQLKHDATIAETKEHPLHNTELFVWDAERKWESVEIVRE